MVCELTFLHNLLLLQKYGPWWFYQSPWGLKINRHVKLNLNLQNLLGFEQYVFALLFLKNPAVGIFYIKLDYSLMHYFNSGQTFSTIFSAINFKSCLVLMILL